MRQTGTEGPSGESGPADASASFGSVGLRAIVLEARSDMALAMRNALSETLGEPVLWCRTIEEALKLVAEGGSPLVFAHETLPQVHAQALLEAGACQVMLQSTPVRRTSS